jgi:hypothetical protein
MARHSGKNLKVEVNDAVIDGCDGFDFEETSASTDLTSAGDAWTDHDVTQKSFSGTITMKADHDAAANQTLRAGDVVTFGGYTEGDAVGRSYVSGSASVASAKISASFDGTVTREYSLTGKGALSVSVVAV